MVSCACSFWHAAPLCSALENPQTGSSPAQIFMIHRLAALMPHMHTTQQLALPKPLGQLQA
jgi:hypothetical protein